MTGRRLKKEETLINRKNDLKVVYLIIVVSNQIVNKQSCPLKLFFLKTIVRHEFDNYSFLQGMMVAL